MRQSVRFFNSYAEKDSRLVEGMLELLEPHCTASRAYDYRFWDFHRLLAGERWDERIQSEIAACDFGLLLLSPRLLASRYIRENEVPALLQRRGVVPVGLKPLDFKLQDWLSLDALQLFRLRTPRGRLRCYSELRGADRDAFALELFRQIERRLAEAMPSSPAKVGKK
jgi:TIR domain